MPDLSLSDGDNRPALPFNEASASDAFLQLCKNRFAGRAFGVFQELQIKLQRDKNLFLERNISKRVDKELFEDYEKRFLDPEISRINDILRNITSQPTVDDWCKHVDAAIGRFRQEAQIQERIENDPKDKKSQRTATLINGDLFESISVLEKTQEDLRNLANAKDWHTFDKYFNPDVAYVPEPDPIVIPRWPVNRSGNTENAPYAVAPASIAQAPADGAKRLRTFFRSSAASVLNYVREESDVILVGAAGGFLIKGFALKGLFAATATSLTVPGLAALAGTALLSATASAVIKIGVTAYRNRSRGLEPERNWIAKAALKGFCGGLFFGLAGGLAADLLHPPAQGSFTLSSAGPAEAPLPPAGDSLSPPPAPLNIPSSAQLSTSPPPHIGPGAVSGQVSGPGSGQIPQPLNPEPSPADQQSITPDLKQPTSLAGPVIEAPKADWAPTAVALTPATVQIQNIMEHLPSQYSDLAGQANNAFSHGDTHLGALHAGYLVRSLASGVGNNETTRQIAEALNRSILGMAKEAGWNPAHDSLLRIIESNEAYFKLNGIGTMPDAREAFEHAVRAGDKGRNVLHFLRDQKFKPG